MSTSITIPASFAEFDAINDPATKLSTWEKLASTLAVVKELEMYARKAVTPLYFPDPKNIEGTQNYELGNGYKLKIVKKLNYNLGGNDKVDAMLAEIETLGKDGEGKFIADRIVGYTPKLSVSEYKALDPANPTHKKIKAAVDAVLTISEGSPELTIIEPKAKA